MRYVLSVFMKVLKQNMLKLTDKCKRTRYQYFRVNGVACLKVMLLHFQYAQHNESSLTCWVLTRYTVG